MKEEPEVNDCQVCGSSFVILEMNHRIPSYRVACGKCGEEGEKFATKDEAVNDWNKEEEVCVALEDANGR